MFHRSWNDMRFLPMQEMEEVGMEEVGMEAVAIVVVME